MRIGINFDNTIVDTNYSLIDFINKFRSKDNYISYSDFDKSLECSIWDYKELTLKEKQYRNIYQKELIQVIDIYPLANNEITTGIIEGDEIHLISSRDPKLKSDIFLLLKRYGVLLDYDKIHLGLDVNNKINKVKELKLDFYIDDEPEVISKAKKNGIEIVVKDTEYNKNYKNLIRLECYSQFKHIKKKIIKNKKEDDLNAE